MDESSRAVIFGRDAGTYEDVRPSYPEPVIEHARSLVDARRAVEVGAGTGKATAEMARDGLEITCLEPSRQMAAILTAKRLPGVAVVVSTFEAWPGESESTDLVYAAQSWHWVDPATGFAKALSILRPGGAIALIWNIPLDRYGRHRETYALHAPQLLVESDERIARRDAHDWRPDMEAAGFAETGRFSHRWGEDLGADRYRALYSTYSDHMMLEEPARSRLLDGLADDVDSWGGTARVEYRTEVFTARKPDTGWR
jgi:SAM-dependent methyltransferase